MKELTPKNIAFRISISIGFFISLCATVIWLIDQSFSFLFSFLILLSSFLISYFALYWTIRKFIEKRFKIIYKTIHNAKLGLKGKVKHINMATDVFGEINKEVIEWDQKNRQQIQRLTEQERFRKEFLGNVSHELKTPIFSIQGYILTLLEGGLEDEKVNRKFLMKAEKSVNRMIEMVEDLDEISRLEYNTLKLQLSEFNIVELSGEVLDSLEYEARKKQVKLSCLSKRPEIMVRADRKKISQVLTNLVVNSIHYNDNRKAETKVKFYDMGENVLVEVQDNGAGIPEEHLERLFERFYRIDKGRSRKEGGTGLGLAIVKHIIEAHNQTIDVRSTENEGSVFSFTLKKA